MEHRIISHRGNLSGPDTEGENYPSFIKHVLELDFDCEIDVWKIANTFYLGHDKPQYEVPASFFPNSKLLIHCKNVEALNYFKTCASCLEYFWHNQDDYTITSQKRIIVYPGKCPIDNCIIMKPEHGCSNLQIGQNVICTDYPFKYQKILSKI